MPLIKVQTSVNCSQDVKEATVKELSVLTAGGIGKPEMYMQALLEDDAVIAFGGEVGDSAFVEVRSIGGLNSSVNNELAKGICDCLNTRLSIEPDRIYINFFDIPRSDWAWKGSTFG